MLFQNITTHRQNDTTLEMVNEVQQDDTQVIWYIGVCINHLTFIQTDKIFC